MKKMLLVVGLFAIGCGVGAEQDVEQVVAAASTVSGKCIVDANGIQTGACSSDKSYHGRLCCGPYGGVTCTAGQPGGNPSQDGCGYLVGNIACAVSVGVCQP